MDDHTNYGPVFDGRTDSAATRLDWALSVNAQDYRTWADLSTPWLDGSTFRRADFAARYPSSVELWIVVASYGGDDCAWAWGATKAAALAGGDQQNGADMAGLDEVVVYRGLAAVDALVWLEAGTDELGRMAKLDEELEDLDSFRGRVGLRPDAVPRRAAA